MSTISRPSLKTQAFIDRWQVDIVDLTGSYVRNPGIKSATILDGAESYRLEEFAARHFRRLGFEATFVESQPFAVLFGVYFWPVRIAPILEGHARNFAVARPYRLDRGRTHRAVWS
jgi:hypothetical protein